MNLSLKVNSGKAQTLTGLRLSRSDLIWCYITIIPFVVLFVGFTIWPIIRTVQFSLYQYNGIGEVDTSPFVGLQNYTTVLNDAIFQQSYANTWLFTLGQTLIKLPLSFFLAVLLTRRWLKWRALFRTAFFVPWLMPPSIVAMVFYYLLNPANGAINTFLTDLHLIQTPINFLGSAPIAFTTIAFISVWQIMGQYVIFWMAALQAIPDEIYEAAEVDGASGWQQVFHITLPLIRPMAIIISSFGLIWALSIFDWVQILTSGGPGTQTYVVYYYIYQKGFAKMPLRYGTASAAGVLFAITVLILFTIIGNLVNRAQRKRAEYGI